MAFGLQFSSLSRPELVDVLQGEPLAKGQGAHIVCTANLDHIVQMRTNGALRAAYDDAWCVTADGMPVFAYVRLKREDVPARVTGSDIVSDLLARLAPGRHRCFFVASCDATADGIRTLLRARGFDDESLAFVVPPFGFERERSRSDDLARRIRDHRPTHVFFGVGAPKSEMWTHRYREVLGDCYVLNAGAGLDYVCGVKKRAPVWMQRTGLEWFWRFGSEPTRLFKRYFVDSWGFLAAIYTDLASGRTAQHRPG